LHSLLNEGVAIFRERLRTRVQDDASALFRQLTTEPEYETLRINENYGLTIIHQEGSAIEVRSAGAEHIVALALMGALQMNAPLRGPIIMDSPFGRLDRGHTTRVLRTLPNMAGQVLLLVYESEIDPSLARNELQGQLKREYRIQRQSARHSNLTPYTEN
jgi:DNA sulfur modification protein DndD